jgi:two-component system sensor kinase FixL
MRPLAEHICKSVASLGDTVTTVTGSVGRPPLEFEILDVNGVLEEAVSLVAPRAETQGVSIHWDTQENLPKVWVDAKYLRRAILNLLVNALDTMPSSGVLGVATRKARDESVEIVVEDTGPGIDPHAADGLFKPFRTTKAEGSGMGLSVVKRIMELHSGSVTIGPRPERGTEAILRIPIRGHDEG